MPSLLKNVKTLINEISLRENTISTVLGILVVLIIASLILKYFQEISSTPKITQEAAQTENSELLEKELPKEYTVVEGDDLWIISEKTYGNGEYWIEIAKENKLSQPNLIYSGWVLTLPKLELKNEGVVLTASSIEAIKDNNYKVVEGDSLWTIAERAYGSGYEWVKIWEANKQQIVNPNYIEVNWNLNLPR